MAGHDIVSAVAGDSGAKRDLARPKVEVDVRELDTRPPEQEFLVMDADSSQLRAIAGILHGQSGVVIGPPGTGKSQTIANLIGEVVANGRRVLFVAEKRAALDVVKNRLTQRGLGELILDIHGALSRKQVMAQFSTALDTVRAVVQPRVDDLHRSFVAHRQRLNEYANRLHRRREPTGYSAYELIGHALVLRDKKALSDIRWKGAALQRMTRAHVGKIEDALRGAAAEPDLFLRTSFSPWTNAALSDRESVEDAVGLVDELNQQLLPELVAQTERCVEHLRLRPPETLADLQPLVGWLGAANQLLVDYQPGLFQLDLPAIMAQLGPGRSRTQAFWAMISNSGYRRAKRRLLSLRRTKVSGARLLADLIAAIDLKTGWEQIAEPGSLPQPYPEAVGVDSARRVVAAKLDQLRRYVRLPLDGEPLFRLGGVLTQLATDRITPVKIPAVRGYEKEIGDLEAESYLQEIRTITTASDRWIPNLRFAWLESCIDQLLLEEPELAIFNGRQHDKWVDEFKRLDRERLEVAIERVKRAYGESVIAAANQHEDQNLLLRKQAALRSRHLPFRELVRRAPAMVTAVKPCWMASPLAVSQLLGGTQQHFDVVIFDEASQVLPEDAVTSILRGRSVVVAGDPNQLPPTQFFAAEREDEEETSADEVPAGFESILNLMISFLPQWSLDWHYRSRDEKLIAFSNHYIYGDRLVTFPSIGGDEPALSHIVVPQTQRGDTEELSSSAEVARVVELILEHAEKRPNMSLGVIAMGIRHANRLDAELTRARRERPELDAFFDARPDEKFFIKNLERVQGDERDCIILSIGYGKDASGKLPYRFGPLLSERGERRLNVAVTRAKHRVTLVSSFSHHDMDPARSNRRGVELLRSYLEYAASGGHVFGDGGPSPIERNAFEIQVQEALERAGLRVLPQFGASRYRIDLVVQHPERPGQSLLAIECDGMTYHSSPTARDRDRLRQEHLEARGWRFVRIWSPDWFARRDEELTRVLAAYERELHRDSNPSPSPPAAVPDAQNLNSPASASAAVAHLSRGPRPRVPRGLSIDDYTQEALITLARWIRSDGLLRTDDQMVEEMMAELGLERRGRRIEAALRDAIESR